MTPSYNQSPYLEATIRSVLLQGYPALDYVIMDGGSSDGSVAIIEKYSEWISHWETGADGGQSAAIRKAFTEHKQAQLMNWLNSDDILTKGSLSIFGRVFSENLDADLIIGTRSVSVKPQEPADPACDLVDNVWQNEWKSYSFAAGIVPQEAAFFSRSAYEKTPGLEPELRHQFDTAHYLRLFQVARGIYVTSFITSVLLSHSAQKTRERKREDLLEHQILTEISAARNLRSRICMRIMRTRYADLLFPVIKVFSCVPVYQWDYEWTTGDFTSTRLV